MLDHSPTVLLIPRTGSVAHLEQNIAAGHVTLDTSARAALHALVGA